MEKKIKVYRLYEESLTKKLKRYIPKPGIIGTVGAIVGAGTGSLAGFVGGAAYHLVTQAGNYLSSGNALDLMLKTYECAASTSGQLGLLGGISGLIFFTKGRDYMFSLFGLKNKRR